MASRYRLHSRLSQRQRTSLRLRYLGGVTLLASAVGLQVLLLGNLGDNDPLLAQTAEVNGLVSMRADLSASPDAIYVSPPTVRNGSGCNAGPTERCLSFTVLLDRDAEGLVFEQIAGDKPTGSTLYYIDCDKAAQIGSSVCIPNHNGKVTISYCAPGNQTGVYRITSIGKVRVDADSTGVIGNPLEFNIAGLDPTTVKWTSVFPGKEGSFDNYLQTATDGSAKLLPDDKCPEQVRFRVSGMHRSACGDDIAFVDTLDVKVFSHLIVEATPQNAVCAQGGAVVLNANAAGGKGPYTFTWKDKSGKAICSTPECSVHAAGEYTVEVTDVNRMTTKQTVNVLTANVSLPANLRVVDAKQENAVVEWNAMPQANRFAVRVREAGSPSWTYKRVNGSETNVKLKDLKPGQTYEMQAMAYGSVDSSGWSATQTFGTEGPCMNANNLRYKIKSGDAWFYWNQNPYCTKQELVIRKKGASDWERTYKFASKVNSVVLDNLKNGVEYEWAIKSYCPAGNYNGVKEFTLSEPTMVSLSNPGSSTTAAAQP